MKVVVLTGGSTPERDVALAGAGQVVGALREKGHDVAAVDTTSGLLHPADEAVILGAQVQAAPPNESFLAQLKAKELGPGLLDLPEVQQADVVFPVLHGSDGEGGALQAMLESAGVNYTGSGPLGSAMAMDKDIAKRLFRSAGIPTPDWHLWPCSDEEIHALGFPLIVKPSKVGSTVGLSVVVDRTGVEGAVKIARGFDDEIILESFVDGAELTVGILGERALAVGEIKPAHDIFDYECKYTPGMCDEIFPAEIDPASTASVQDLALRVHVALKLRDYSRIDFRVGQGGTTYCLEANTLPGLTPTSLLPQSAAAAGIPFADLCDQIVKAAGSRWDGRNNVPETGIKK